jgi:hypothetical protein
MYQILEKFEKIKDELKTLPEHPRLSSEVYSAIRVE